MLLSADERVCVGRTIKNKKVQEAKLTRDDRFFIFDPTHQFQDKKLTIQDKHHDDDDGDSCIDGSSSTPRVSSEWRSSIHFKDSETEEALSSSSRRSCPKWESYTLFQKYHEEMSILDRISAQKLEETEYLGSMEASPRSISDRIASIPELKDMAAASKCVRLMRNSLSRYQFFLEDGLQSLTCHGWRHEADSGCPASTAQQFQQFQVLLQRYIDGESTHQEDYRGKHHLVATNEMKFCLDASPKHKLISKFKRGTFTPCRWDANQILLKADLSSVPTDVEAKSKWDHGKKLLQSMCNTMIPGLLVIVILDHYLPKRFRLYF
ncbi:hypothetical protein S83_070068 [Arachis hypogaea]